MSWQNLQPLSPDHRELLDRLRESVWLYIREEDAEDYAYADFKLGLIEALVERSELHEALGVILGDALEQTYPWTWVSAEDPDGAEPALFHPSTRQLLYPLGLIRELDFNPRAVFEQLGHEQKFGG